MACEDLRGALVALQNKYAALEKSIADTPPQERAIAQHAAQPQLNRLNAQIVTASAALSKCLAALLPPPPQRVPGAQPKEILHIQFQTPNFGGNGTGNNWAATIGGGTYPFHQGFEWKQVMSTDDEYDRAPVGATGWVAYQDVAAEDFMPLHPFGNDWEFSCVLDPEYLNLLSQGNIGLGGLSGPKIADDLVALGVPQEPDIRNAVQQGLLGVEWESELVPGTFQDEFKVGDRVAVFGRWIVDCGHDDFHTEIHPPLFMAAASVYKQPSAGHLTILQSGVQYTRALFTSRPYLVGQNFVNRTITGDLSAEQIYNDNSGDDGHFFGHMQKEIAKAASPIPFLGSNLLEAHPKIKQYPFQGVHVFEVVVRTTQAAPIAIEERLVVSFHFTVRSGCGVEVIKNDASSVRVLVSMNSVGFTPPPLPTRNDHTYSVGELNNSFGGGFWTNLLAALGAAALAVLSPKELLVASRGLQSDVYDPLPGVDFRDSTSPNSVIKASADAIPSGKGISIDNTQPYPIVGWLEVGYASTGTIPVSESRIVGTAVPIAVKPVVDK